MAQHRLHRQRRLHPPDQQEAHRPLLSAGRREQVSIHGPDASGSAAPGPYSSPFHPRTSKLLRVMWLQILTPHLQFTREILTLEVAVNSGTHPRPPRSPWERLVGPESRSWAQAWCSLAKGREWNQGPGYEILHQACQPSSTRHDEGWRGYF